jgi:hypothetical protein
MIYYLNFRTVLESNNTKKSITEFEKIISDTKSPTENNIENLVNNLGLSTMQLIKA